MTMLRDEVAEINPVTNKQLIKMRRLLDEHEVPEHFAECLRNRMLVGDLSRREAWQAINRLLALPRKTV